jgi:hypothetical protein
MHTLMNLKEAWRIEHEKIESMYRGDVDQIFIGHHAEFLHQYCKLRRKMKKPGEGILEIQQRIDENYPIALKKADECFPGTTRARGEG